jgi:PmbA protein
MIDKIIGIAQKKNVEAEVYLSKQKRAIASFENNKLKQFEDVDEEGIGLRIINNNKVGFISTTNLKQKPEILVEKAISLSKINKKNPHITFGTASISDNSFLCKGIPEIPSSDIFNESNQLLNNTLDKLDKNGIKGILSGFIQKTEFNIAISTTNGVDSSYNKAVIYRAIFGKAKNYSSLECDEVDVSISSKGKSIEEISNNFTNKLKNSIKPKETSQLKKQYVFHPKALGELLYFTFGRAISGENIKRQKSFLADKIEEKITPQHISLIDWGNSKQLPSGRPFDDESTPTQKRAIIEKGVLKEAIYDLEWGKRARKTSTGNASRDYNTLPHISLNSIYIPSTEKNVFEEVKDGYYIVNTTGAHTANNITGNFGIVLVGAYQIKSGEIQQPLYGPVLSTSCLNLLKSIRNIGEDTKNLVFGNTAINFGSALVEF